MKPLALLLDSYPTWLRRARYYAGNADDGADSLQDAAESLLRRSVDVGRPESYLTAALRNQARRRRRLDEHRRAREMAFEPVQLEPPDPQRKRLAHHIYRMATGAQRRAIRFYVRRQGEHIPPKHRTAMAYLRRRLAC